VYFVGGVCELYQTQKGRMIKTTTMPLYAAMLSPSLAFYLPIKPKKDPNKKMCVYSFDTLGKIKYKFCI
jgi:hypothetical protein